MEHETEVVSAALLAIASGDLREGRIIPAYTIFGALAKVDFTYQGEALIGEALALKWMPNPDNLEASRKKLQKLVEVEQYQSATVFRANALRFLAEVNIGLQNFEEATMNLEEAHEIYKTQGTMRELSQTLRLQGLLYVHDNKFKAALIDKFSWRKPLSEFEFQFPDTLPTGFGIEGIQQEINDEASLVGWAGAGMSAGS